MRLRPEEFQPGAGLWCPGFRNKCLKEVIKEPDSELFQKPHTFPLKQQGPSKAPGTSQSGSSPKWEWSPAAAQHGFSKTFDKKLRSDHTPRVSKHSEKTSRLGTPILPLGLYYQTELFWKWQAMLNESWSPVPLWNAVFPTTGTHRSVAVLPSPANIEEACLSAHLCLRCSFTNSSVFWSTMLKNNSCPQASISQWER